jgi:hypothetical protein
MSLYRLIAEANRLAEEKHLAKAEHYRNTQPVVVAGMPARQFMGKALVAHAAGRITATDVAVAENQIGAGRLVPTEIVTKVLGEHYAP